MKIAIIGAGWAGMAAAVAVSQAGQRAIVFEASRALGGRARALNGTLPDGSEVTLDNGQHILIGAYTETLALMRQVGVNPEEALLRLPLTLRFPDGGGLTLPDWPSPWDALAGMLGAQGWSAGDKWSLLAASTRWQLAGFKCAQQTTVASLCTGVSPRVMAELIEPLCVSALNTPADRASAQVLLRVLRDSLFGARGGSNLLLPRTDLSSLFPQAAAHWIGQRGGEVRLGTRAERIVAVGNLWRVNDESFDAVILAVSAPEAVRALVDCAQTAPESIANRLDQWAAIANQLHFEAITTVYAHATGAALPYPLLALRSHADQQTPLPAPAQFVFDRGQLGGPAGLLAFVVSASSGDRDVLQTQVLAQAQQQLGLRLQPVQTVVEKRATFACTPGLERPPMQIAPGLLACGDYVAGPYPATLEGAVRAGLAAGQASSLTAP
jgi:hydroxysqualene dehydroxylase